MEKTEDEEENLGQEEAIVKFLNKHSKYGKTVREIDHFLDTVSHRIYKITGSEEEIVIKVPKKLTDAEKERAGFLDLIFETQLAQIIGHSAFYPKVEEELIVVNPNSKTVLNYITLMQYPDTSVINMLAGPTAMNFKGNENDFDEEGYRSQEIFTMEKYFFIYYKGLLLLEHLYKNGIVHG